MQSTAVEYPQRDVVAEPTIEYNNNSKAKDVLLNINRGPKNAVFVPDDLDL